MSECPNCGSPLRLQCHCEMESELIDLRVENDQLRAALSEACEIARWFGEEFGYQRRAPQAQERLKELRKMAEVT